MQCGILHTNTNHYTPTTMELAFIFIMTALWIGPSLRKQNNSQPEK